MNGPDEDQVRAFFDQLAPRYVPVHGSPGRLIDRIIILLRRYGRFGPDHTVLDLGCGPGFHLKKLSPMFRHGIGIDLSEQMVSEARRETAGSASNLSFRVDDATKLATVADQSIDRVISVGALEHIPNKYSVFQQVSRVLRRDGRFVGFVGNGDYVWHTVIGPRLRLETRQLPSDLFLTAGQVRRYARMSGLELLDIDYWSFVPSGDMPLPIAWLMHSLDLVGSAGFRRLLWGGLRFVIRR